MSHPSTHQPMLPRPSYTTATSSQEESNLPVSDTETENIYTLQSDNTNLSSLQDHLIHLPRPPCNPKPTKQHQPPCFNKNQQNEDNPMTQKVRPTPKPSYIPVLNNKRHKVTPHITQPETQPTISSLPRPSEETIIEQPRQIHPEPTPITKSPLLPTPPVQVKHADIPRPSAFYNRKPTFSGPSPINNHRFHQQHHISRPYTTRFNNQQPPVLPRPSCQHQNFFTRPYPQHQQAQEHFFTRPYQQHQQPQGHCTQQVYHVHISLPYPPQYCAA